MQETDEVENTFDLADGRHGYRLGGKLLRMKVAESSSRVPADVYVVETAEQARLITDPVSVRFFKPFLAAKKTMAEVAEELGCPLSTLYYRVRRFVEAGLLIVVEERKRKGRAMKVYSSPKPKVFVPFVLTPHATLEEGLAEQLMPVWQTVQAGLAQTYGHERAQGRKLFRDEHGVVLTSFNTFPDGREGFASLPTTNAFYSDLSLWLTQQEALDLHGRLLALFREVYSASQKHEADDATKPYLFQAALISTE